MLDIVIVLSLMIGAVAYVVVDPARSVDSSGPVAESAETKTEDFVNTHHDLPPPPGECAGESRLDQWLVNAATGGQNAFRDDVNRSFPAGVDANLLFKNDYGELYLHKEFDNPAIAGHGISYSPNWSGTYVLPSLGVATGTERVEINAAAIVDGELQMQKGDGVEILVTFADGHQKRIYASTALIGEVWQARQFTQNLTAYDLDAEDRHITIELEEGDIAAEPVKDPVKLAFMVSPGPQGTSTTPAVIPAGTTLRVQFPPQWYGFDYTFTSADWAHSEEGDLASGYAINFVLASSSATDELIRFEAMAPTTPTLPFDTIMADLSEGGLAHAEIAVAYPIGVDKSLPRTVHASVPYPVRAGSSTIMGVGVANGGDATDITRIDILLPGGFDMRNNNGEGAELFAAGESPEAVDATGSDGSWKRVNSQHIQWNGERPINAGGVAEFLVSVNITSDLGEATSMEGAWTPRVQAELTYENAYTTTSTGWGSTPGFVRTLVRPDSLTTTDADGYPYSELTGTQTLNYEVDAEISMPMVTMTGSAEYTILPGTTDLGNVQSALGNASVHVSDRIAPLGSLVKVENDVSSILTTLADEGAGGITLSTELYTPATLACGPTHAWTRDASTLPLARLNDLAIFDDTGLGAPSIFIASEDKNAYEVGALGTTAWSTLHAAEVSTISAASLPIVGSRAFTGTTNGNVARLDPTLTGTADWTITHYESADDASDPTIRAIAYDQDSSRLLVQSDQVIEVLDADTGAHVGAKDTIIITNTVAQADWDSDGTIVALTTHHLQRLDASAGLVRAYGVEDAIGFSITPAGILVARGDKVLIHDPIWLAPTGNVELGGRAVLTAAGDATGDGVMDLVVALDTLDVQIVNGATGTIVATYSGALPNLAEYGVGIPTVGPIESDENGIHFDTFDPVLSDCPDTGLVNAYDVGQACVALSDPNNLLPVPLLLEAADGRVLYSYRLGSVSKTVAWQSDGSLSLDMQWDPAIVPTSMTMGEWTLGAWVSLIGTSDGKLWLFSEATENVIWVVEPTAMTGKFEFTLRVPMGGFFGTNILLTRIQWEDPVFGDQEIVIPEWFQVVAPDGTPVLDPWYTVSTLVQLPDHQMVTYKIGP